MIAEADTIERALPSSTVLWTVSGSAKQCGVQCADWEAPESLASFKEPSSFLPYLVSGENQEETTNRLSLQRRV